MDLLHEITENNIVTPSLCDFLFGKNENKRRRLFNTINDYPKLLYNVCLFYSVLTQAYLIACVQENEKEQEGENPFTLKDIVSEKACAGIFDIWNANHDYDYDKDKYKVFNFFIKECPEIDDPNVFADDALDFIYVVRDAFQKFEEQKRGPRNLISELKFLSLLKSLKLLQYASIDKAAEIITFSVPDRKAFTMKCRPFIFFIDQETRLLTDGLSGHPYIMASAMKGERNGELGFSVVELNSYDITPRSEELTVPVMSDEYLLHLCRTLCLETEPYPVGEFMGNYLFFRRLTDIAEDVILCFLEDEHGCPYKDNENILPDLHEMFVDTDLYKKIEEEEYLRIIDKDNIDKILFDFFINFGVFKTMWCLLLDTGVHSREEMFEAFLDEFKKRGIIDASQYDAFLSKCNKEIESHINKLRTIVVDTTGSFLQRSREIKAEWRAFYILQAAGIEKEKLFADVESVLSIDDYFDMIKNKYTTSEQDIKSVLSFLIAFYSPLVSEDYNESSKFYADAVRQAQADLAEKPYTVSELFDKFIKIATDSADNEHIMKLIGRKYICSVKPLNEYKRKFEEDNLSQDIQQHELISEKKIFISYSHKNAAKVHEIVDLLKARNINVLIDKDMFKGGDRWRVRAEEVIRDDDCIGVMAFMSEAAAESQHVVKELGLAKGQARERYPGISVEASRAQDRFIIPINLENREFEEYLKEKKESKDKSIRKNAETLEKIIVAKDDNNKNEKIFYKADDPKLIDKLVEQIEEIIKEDEAGGYEVNTKSFKGAALDMANFYIFLKTGQKVNLEPSMVLDAFQEGDLSHCIFPLVVSVKEARIKRDNVTLLGYEIVKGKGRSSHNDNYILSPQNLTTMEDYYCIPNYQKVGEDCSWMIEPLLIPHECFKKQKSDEVKA